MFLSYEELVQLTEKERPSAQARALRRMGIEHKLRPNGTVAVLRTHVHRVFGESKSLKPERETEPDWSALASPSPRP